MVKQVFDLASTDRLSRGKGLFQEARVAADLLLFQDEVYETRIKAGFLSG